jgi:hypothetical protein
MRKILAKISRFPVAPIFLGWSFILILYLHNIGELNPDVLVKPLAAVLSGEIIFYLILRKFTGNEKSVIIQSLLTAMFFSYADNLTLVKDLTGNFGWLRSRADAITLGVYFLVLAGVIRFIGIYRKYIASVLLYLLTVSVIVSVSPLISITRFEITQRAGKNVTSQFKLPAAPLKIDKAELPDIYYIIPDSYSASVNLKKYFGYDNSAFSDYLTSKGFYIADGSTSNYPKTYLSLSSSLNMEYLDFLSVNTDSINETIVDPLIKNNNLLLFLKKQGYSYYQLGSWWWSTQHNKLANKNYNLDLVNPTGINAFNSIIITSSILKPLLPDKIFDSVVTESVEDKRRRIIYQFETLPEVSRLPGPKFVFAHIIAPHGPNVFGKNCEFITQESLIGLTDEVGYTNQVNCINNYLKNTIDAIFRNSAKPPVIVIQSDEGAPFLADRLTPSNNWKSADTKMLREKFPIMAAVYFPDGDYQTLYKTITPVNEFRVILNKYFGLGIPLAEDRNFVNLDMEHLYQFKEVTGQLGK